MGIETFVCVTVGPVLERDRSAVSALLGHGERRNFFAAGAKRNRAVLRFLTQQSRPAVVKVHLLVSAASQLGFYPPIANLLLGRFREMPGVQDDVFSRAAVMPDSISAIEFLERR